MKTLCAAAALLFAATGPANAGQPFEESLVECAVLIELMTGEQTPVSGQSAELEYFVGTAANMRAEAVRRSDANYVERTAAEKRQVWHDRWDAGKWDNLENREDLVEWWTYCFKFAEHLEVEGPTPFD
ncbi:hypothetical protein [Donghicola sp.]|uniref:hypothetical protein n=1 Tax=Donghicola sp. TaxID=1929294 RepID=UPI0025F04BA3|nr:hypothetical protein [Donghicola sp.]MCT4577211.1 hypothetical protein [Donghicola sp.]